jgi:mutator protein MutT
VNSEKTNGPRVSATPPASRLTVPPVIEVSAGLVFRSGRLLITQRPARGHLANLWEFPGGKREPGESFEQCLVRELREELAVEVRVEALVEEVTHPYPEKAVHLRFYRCALLSGEPRPLGCQALAWVSREELGRYAFPAADARLLDALQTRAEWWG